MTSVLDGTGRGCDRVVLPAQYQDWWLRKANLGPGGNWGERMDGGGEGMGLSCRGRCPRCGLGGRWRGLIGQEDEEVGAEKVSQERGVEMIGSEM